MILAVDIGNTHINLALFKGEEIRHHWTLATVVHRTADEYGIIVDRLLAKAGIDPPAIKGAVIASVVPRLTGVWEELAGRLAGADNVLVLDADTPTGIENRYESPRDVGPDRLANGVAANAKYGAPVIVVDFGTAITLDVVSSDGAYLGGAIMPGLEMAAEGLGRKTARLPSVSIADPGRAIGNSTDRSIQSGIFYGTVGAIDSLIERIQAELGGECTVVATGGDAGRFVEPSRYIQDADPFLTLSGLQKIWQLNQA